LEIDDKSGGGDSDDEGRRKMSDDELSNVSKSPKEKAGGTADLFGDASDISESEEEGSPVRKRLISDSDSGGEGRRSRSRSRSPSKAAAEKQPEEPQEEDEPAIPETKIEAEIPKINTDLGRQIHFVKLPNFLSVETRPFDRETYEDEINDEETLDEEGRARLKLKVENTIRWRVDFDAEGNAIRESNAKLVKWSDGSLSLHLGSEIFDVYKQPLQGDHNHLFIRQGTGLQGQAVFRTKLSFRPHSTESFTHRKILNTLADRSMKSSGVKVLSQVIKDPDMRRDELWKRDEDKLKASMRRQVQQKKVKAKDSKGLTKGYLEDEDEDNENSFSISQIKAKAKQTKQKAAENVYSDSDSDLSDIEPKGKKAKATKRKAVTDSEEEEEEARKSSSGSESDAKSKKSRKSDSGSGSESDAKSKKSRKSESGSGSESDAKSSKRAKSSASEQSDSD